VPEPAPEPLPQALFDATGRTAEKNRFGHWAELKAAFNAIDKVGELTVPTT